MDWYQQLVKIDFQKWREQTVRVACRGCQSKIWVEEFGVGSPECCCCAQWMFDDPILLQVLQNPM
jgi:hypothetical protein